MRWSFSHGAVASRPCIANGEGVGKKIDKVWFTSFMSILSFLGYVTASLSTHVAGHSLVLIFGKNNPLKLLP